MTYYILDKDNCRVFEDDGEFMTFKSQREAFEYLKSCDYKDSYIKENFILVHSVKLLTPEEIPEFNKAIEEMPQSSKDKVDISLMAANRFPLQKNIRVFGNSSEMIEGLRNAYKLGISDWGLNEKNKQANCEHAVQNLFDIGWRICGKCGKTWAIEGSVPA